MSDVPEVYANISWGPNGCKKRLSHGKGYNRKPRAQGRQSWSYPNGGNSAPKHNSLTPMAFNFKNKGKASATIKTNICYRCDSKDHWSWVFRALICVVVDYHSRHEVIETNFVQVDNSEDTTMKIFFIFKRHLHWWKIRTFIHNLTYGWVPLVAELL